MPLYLNNTDLTNISETITEAGQHVMQAFRRQSAVEASVVQPDMITEALGQLIEIMYMIEVDQASTSIFTDMPFQLPRELQDQDDYQPLSSEEISELGDHGLSLIETLSEWAGNLELTQEEQQLRAVMIIVSLWIARHGGYLSSLSTVVDTLAQIANKTDDTKVLKELSFVMGELISAVHNDVRYARHHEEQREIWRILNINRGIIAARTNDPRVIETVFDQLVLNIPTEAAEFFEKNLQKMDTLACSAHTQSIMQRYFFRYSQRVLH